MTSEAKTTRRIWYNERDAKISGNSKVLELIDSTEFRRVKVVKYLIK